MTISWNCSCTGIFFIFLLCNGSLWNFDQDYSGYVLGGRKCTLWQLLFSTPFSKQQVNIRAFCVIHAHQLPHRRLTYPSLVATHFFLKSPVLLPSLSCSPDVLSIISSCLLPFLSATLLSSLSHPNVRRCGKRHVLSFPQCSAGCQCRR